MKIHYYASGRAAKQHAEKRREGWLTCYRALPAMPMEVIQENAAIRSWKPEAPISFTAFGHTGGLVVPGW